MKKFALIMGVALMFATTAVAKDTYAHDASVLPEAARTTISNNFKSQVSVVKIEKDFGRIKEYEVTLTDGTEISFDSKGNWDNIETANNSCVPSAFIPKSISSYIAKNQPGTRIVGIDKERKGYDIELSNGVDMKFNSAGQFLRYDD